MAKEVVNNQERQCGQLIEVVEKQTGRKERAAPTSNTSFEKKCLSFSRAKNYLLLE